MARPVRVLSFLGTKLDRSPLARRWDRWRPNVALGMHEDLLVHRVDLLTDESSIDLAETVTADLASVSPETSVVHHQLPFTDPWDFEEVFSALLDLSQELDVDPAEEDLLVHITTGTHVCQICLFLLVESRFLPGRLLQSSPDRRSRAGTYRVIDLDLARYDGLARRFATETQEARSFLKSGIETRNERFNELIEQIEHVAIRSEDPILLTGPTGAGKSRLARKIHELKRSRRQVEGRFVEVNCATIRGDGAMSALFGHRAGAFTGAVKARSGLLKEADGGLLF
ncbi:MAG: RNA repair transcriptional activator RtcR family protein, partial [Acidobacteriota bacterium]